ncbi:MAG: dihydrofolate reductase family protein [Bacteroidota bacterium]
MKKLIVTVFMTMDGVIQAPGAREEDPTNEFPWGGWIVPFSDPEMNEAMGHITAEPYDLLLGRRTYEIFASHWPYQVKDPMSDLFNSIQKYVVATKPVDLSWQNSTLISGEVPLEIKKLKEQNIRNLFVWGSSELVQTLLEHQLIDVLNTLTYPITLGKGKKLFGEGTQPLTWKITNSTITPKGIIIASYVPSGAIDTGAFQVEEASQREMQRRGKITKTGDF